MKNGYTLKCINKKKIIPILNCQILEYNNVKGSCLPKTLNYRDKLEKRFSCNILIEGRTTLSHLIVRIESRFPAGNFFIAHGIGAKTVKKLCVGSILSAPETSARNRPILNMPLVRSPVLNSEFLVSI